MRFLIRILKMRGKMSLEKTISQHITDSCKSKRGTKRLTLNMDSLGNWAIEGINICPSPPKRSISG